MEQLNAILDMVITFLTDPNVLMGGSLIWILLAKVIPNGQAGKIGMIIITVADIGAKLCEKVGDLLHGVSDFIGKLIKSDGFLGRK